MSDVLHTYQCSNCHATAVATFWTPGVRVDCVLCRRWMKHLFAQPVTTEEHQKFAGRGLVFNPHLPRRPRKCDTCKQPMPEGPSVTLECVGKFCGEDCAQVGVLKHERWMQKLADEQEELNRKLQPWKYAAKE